MDNNFEKQIIQINTNMKFLTINDNTTYEKHEKHETHEKHEKHETYKANTTYKSKNRKKKCFYKTITRYQYNYENNQYNYENIGRYLKNPKLLEKLRAALWLKKYSIITTNNILKELNIGRKTLIKYVSVLSNPLYKKQRDIIGDISYDNIQSLAYNIQIS
jgi:hypothetical protein